VDPRRTPPPTPHSQVLAAKENVELPKKPMVGDVLSALKPLIGEGKFSWSSHAEVVNSACKVLM
jgi:hypothetical protein